MLLPAKSLSLSFLVVLFASSAAAQSGSLDQRQIHLSYSENHGYLTRNDDLYVNGQRVGSYWISGTLENNGFDASVSVYNTTACDMYFDGMYYVGRSPVGTIAWSRGAYVAPGSRIELTGRVSAYNVDVDSAFSFAPSGYLTECR